MIHVLEQNVRGELPRAATGKDTQERNKGGGLRDWCKFAEKEESKTRQSQLGRIKKGL